MTERNPAAYLQAGSHDAETFRRVIEALIASQGVVSSSDLAVTAKGTPDMSVNVATGEAFIIGTEQTEQGAYHVYNDATVNKTIATADATNPRYDLIVAKVKDSEYSGSDDEWSLAVVTGTPAASPADPAVPSNSITLARVQVDAGVTSIVSGKITDVRTYAITNGPRGYMGRAQATANQAGITVSTDLTGLTVTFTAVAGRRYRITTHVIGQQITAGADQSVSIYEGATELQRATISLSAAFFGTFNPTLTVSPSAGAHTYKLKGMTTAGTMTMHGSATYPASIIVEDIGI